MMDGNGTTAQTITVSNFAVASANAVTIPVWTGANSTTWSDPGNWSGGVPGSTGVTNNTDTATFNANPTNAVPVVDMNRNLQGITFTSAAVGALTLGTTTGNSLLMTKGGTIQTAASVTNPEVINAPLILEGTGSGDTYTFTSGATSATATLSFGGGIMAGAGGGTTTLTLNGANTGANTISGILADGAFATLAVTKSAAGTWTLAGANTYSGITTISAGTLNLAASGSLGNTAISVAGSATFAPQPLGGSNSAGSSAAGTGGATLSLAAGAIFSMVDGNVGTFNLQQQASFGAANTALTLSGATMNFELNSTAADKLAVNVGAVAVSSANSIGITALGSSLTTGTYPVITAPSITGSGTFQFSGGAQNAFVASGGNVYQLSLQSERSTAVNVAVAAAPTLPVTTSLYAWYDASHGVTSANGLGVAGTVNAWADQSGNGHNLSNVSGGSASAIALNLTGFNGHPGVDFTTNSQSVALATASNFGLTGSQNITVFGGREATPVRRIPTPSFSAGTRQPARSRWESSQAEPIQATRGT